MVISRKTKGWAALVLSAAILLGPGAKGLIQAEIDLFASRFEESFADHLEHQNRILLYLLQDVPRDLLCRRVHWRICLLHSRFVDGLRRICTRLLPRTRFLENCTG